MLPELKMSGNQYNIALSIFFIPVLYVILKTLLARFSKEPEPAPGGELPETAH